MLINTFKTVALLAALSALLVALGNLFAGTQGVVIALILAALINGIMYFFSDKIVLRMYGAKKLDPLTYDWIYQIVEELSGAMKIPMPKLWLVETRMANAFATGRNPAHGSVAVTTGILQILDRDELRGVLAHELSHIKNRDVLVSTIAATMATAIGQLGNMMQRMALWGSVSSDRKQRGNPVLMMLVGMVVPLAATLIQLAVSRSREFLADETGAHSCHDPLALASALEKLHSSIPHAHPKEQDPAHAAMASLCIVNPFSGSSVLSWFSTHPPVAQRIARLHDMHRKMF